MSYGDLKTYESIRKLHRHLEHGPGQIVAATITERRGQWTISFIVKVQRAVPATKPPERVIGVDAGLSTLYTGATPEGEHVLDMANPRHLVSARKKLAHAQRIASRRQGPRQGVAPPKRWQRANTRVQKIHASVAHLRRNLTHETTSMLAKNYDLIVVEDLNTKGMVKNHSLALHVSHASWGRDVPARVQNHVVRHGRTLPPHINDLQSLRNSQSHDVPGDQDVSL